MWGNGGATWETSYRCCIMKKVIRKEVGAGGGFDCFLDAVSEFAGENFLSVTFFSINS